MLGPGSDVSVDACAQGPITSRVGHSELLERPQRVVAIPVGPAGHDHRRAAIRSYSRSERALAPVGPSSLFLEPPQQPRLRPSTRSRPPSRHPAPAIAGTGGRALRATMYAGSRPGRVASTPRRCSARRRCTGRRWRRSAMIAFSAGGRSARHLDRIEPRVAGPVHPDRPVDHGCSPASRSPAQVGRSLGRVLVGRHPLRRPRPTQVDPGHRIPVLGAQPFVLRRYAEVASSLR